MKKSLPLAGAIFVLAVCVASPVLAHTDLVKSPPAADSTVTSPKSIVLTFSEKVAPTFSGFDLAMDDGMKVALTKATSSGWQNHNPYAARIAYVGKLQTQLARSRCRRWASDRWDCTV